MSDSPGEWKVTLTDYLSWTVVFRTFRLATQPGKILLATAGLLLTYLVGWALDSCWQASGVPVLPGEVRAFVVEDDFAAWKRQQLAVCNEALGALLVEYGVYDARDEAVEALGKDRGEQIGKLREAIAKKYEKLIDLDEREKTEKTRIKALEDEQQRKEATKKLEEELAGLVAESRARYRSELDGVRRLGNQRVFGEWWSHLLNQGVQAMRAVRAGSVLGGMGSPIAAAQESAPSLLGALTLMAGGGWWLISEHPWFGVLFLVPFLAIWSLLGGAICRMAALQATRDERISLGEALSFARRKWLDFLLAPLIPGVFIAAVGLLLFLGGWLLAVPVVGELLGGLLFPLALLGGFVIAVVMIGAAAGKPLFWPTVAVEGSDSFDAISRSYSYVFNRPWRAIFLGLVTLVYGAFCYLFVRVFVWLMLLGTHVFLSLGAGVFADRPEAGVGRTKLDVMWPAPQFDSLMPRLDYLDQIRAEPAGALLIWIFVGIVVAATHAFVLSFYFCGSTWIYLLLRQKVDATDIEDVYLEDAVPAEIEEAPAEPSATPAAISPPPGAGGTGEAPAPRPPAPPGDAPQ